MTRKHLVNGAPLMQIFRIYLDSEIQIPFPIELLSLTLLKMAEKVIKEEDKETNLNQQTKLEPMQIHGS